MIQGHPWHILNEKNEFKGLVDIKGHSGKSQFFKWLYHTYPNKIGRLGYASASQLKSSVVNLKAKKLYIIDLARSKSRDDREEDLLSLVEDLKSGLVINAPTL